jgi:hypothetical protein
MLIHKGKVVLQTKKATQESRHQNEYDQAKETRSHRYWLQRYSFKIEMQEPILHKIWKHRIDLFLFTDR